MLRLGLKVGIGHTEVVVAAELKKPLYILVDLTSTKMAQTGGPRVMIGTHSSIEVTQNN